jgi:lysophospholipase L1-like esterase
MSRSLKLALAPLLIAQGLWTRRRTPRLPEAAGARSGVVGQGARLRLLVVGDSSAAGVGVEHQSQALAELLAQALALRCARRVQWQLVARSGITSAQLLPLLRAERPAPADLALVTTGVNDVVDQVPIAQALAARAALADWLRAQTGVRHVAFAELPPMHRFPALPQPLRWVAGAEARRHDRALATWAAGRADTSHVPLGLSLEPAHMARDGFHPGEAGYRVCAACLAASLQLLVARWCDDNDEAETGPLGVDDIDDAQRPGWALPPRALSGGEQRPAR